MITLTLTTRADARTVALALESAQAAAERRGDTAEVERCARLSRDILTALVEAYVPEGAEVTTAPRPIATHRDRETGETVMLLRQAPDGSAEYARNGGLCMCSAETWRVRFEPIAEKR